MRRSIGYVLVSLALAFGGFWAMTQVDLTQFSAGDLIEAAEGNDNFAQIATALSGKQERVDGSCAEGSAIRVVHADGSVAFGQGGELFSTAAPSRLIASDFHHLSMLKQPSAGDHVESCVVQETVAEKFVEGSGATWATLRRVGAA